MSTVSRRAAAVIFAGALCSLALGEHSAEDAVSLLQKDATRRKRALSSLPTDDIPPVAFIKTHKTGGTTLSNLLFRLGEARNKTFMLGCDTAGECRGGGKLGWPWSFPGPIAELAWGAPRQQFDMLCNHAVYDDAVMRSFLKPQPLFVTLLREPSTQLRSAFDYFQPHTSADWSGRLQALRNVDAGSDQHNWAHFINPQASDLGWQRYALARPANATENVTELVRSWLTELRGNMSLVLISEYYDQGLVLLARKLGLKARDMAYVRVQPPDLNSTTSLLQASAAPPHGLGRLGSLTSGATSRELEELRRLEYVDFELYRFFNATFWHDWRKEGGDAGLAGELDELRNRSAELAQRVCKTANETWRVRGEGLAADCDWRLTANDVEYPTFLLSHMQAQKDLLLQTPVPAPA